MELDNSQDLWVPVLGVGLIIKVTASVLKNNVEYYKDVDTLTTAVKYLKCYLKRCKRSRKCLHKTIDNAQSSGLVLDGVVCYAIGARAGVLPVYLQDPAMQNSQCVGLQLPNKLDSTRTRIVPV
jgi:hypothetical protein